MDPLTIARLLLAGGQLAGGLMGMRDRDEDRRGQERIRQLLQQAQDRNLQQASAIAGSGAGISPALAQRAALDAVTRANESATQSALDQEAQLAERDRDRADRLMGARLGALGAFGSQLLTALQGDDDDDDTDSDVDKTALGLGDASNIFDASSTSGTAPAASTPSATGTAAATPGAAAQAVVAAQQAAEEKPPEPEQTAMEQFLAYDPNNREEGDETTLGKSILPVLEGVYGRPEASAPLFEGAAPSEEEFARTNLGVRSQDIPMQGRVPTDSEGRSTLEYDRVERVARPGTTLTTEGETVQDVLDRTSQARLDDFAPAAVVSQADIEDRHAREVMSRNMSAGTNPYDVTDDGLMFRDDPYTTPLEAAQERLSGRRFAADRRGAPTTTHTPSPGVPLSRGEAGFDTFEGSNLNEQQREAVARDLRLAQDEARREAQRLRGLSETPLNLQDESTLLPETDLAGRSPDEVPRPRGDGSRRRTPSDTPRPSLSPAERRASQVSARFQAVADRRDAANAEAQRVYQRQLAEAANIRVREDVSVGDMQQELARVREAQEHIRSQARSGLRRAIERNDAAYERDTRAIREQERFRNSPEGQRLREELGGGAEENSGQTASRIVGGETYAALVQSLGPEAAEQVLRDPAGNARILNEMNVTEQQQRQLAAEAALSRLA